ncbi:MAG: DUF5320 domain-containing protein [Lentisphaeria bacterium]|nr:DUF5320 domain-containing protein [Lentisphaeria bacterium]
MPRGNGTGPNGMGPMTGRGAGFCAGFETAGFANPAPGYGMGRGGRGMGGAGLGLRRGAGAGRGLGRRFAGALTRPMVSAEDERAALREQVTALRTNADKLEKQLRQLESDDAE